MGWALRTGWHLTVFCAILAALGGLALMFAFVNTAGHATGQGLVGTKVFVGAVTEGYADADAYQQKLAEAEANQAAREQAAKDKRAKARAKAQGN